MKLKQRLWSGVSLIGGAVFMYLVLNLMSVQRVADLDHPNLQIKQRELQSVHSQSQDKEPDNVSNLVQALMGFAKKSSGPLNTDGEAWTKELARRLLNDKSFNSSDNIDHVINIGKFLDETIHPKPDKSTKARVDDSRHVDSVVDTDKSRLPEAQLNDGDDQDNFDQPDTNARPVFHLDKAAYSALTKYISKYAERHRALVHKTKTPMSFKVHRGTKLSNWQKWQNGINQDHLYTEKTQLIDLYLSDLANGKITGLSTLPDYGTQIKLVFKYDDGSQALFKPMRWARDRERDPNLFYFDDFERHQAEIAAFHLDRVMQFYRVPPNTGRFINITSTIEPYASRSLKKTIYTSPGGNKCFYGKCDYYCDSGHPVCGQPDLVEGAVAAWLPFAKGTSKKSWENPWRRSYSKFRQADWENNPNYCDNVKKTAPYNTGRRLLDLMDITIFDFIAGNQDRHHYHTFKVFGNQSSPILYDNGRGFGFMHYDDASILIPVVQCCRIRYSTLSKLLKYEAGPEKLSVLMRRSLSRDPVSAGPNGLVLHEDHLKALDRRVSKVLDVIWYCVQDHRFSSVIADDGF